MGRGRAGPEIVRVEELLLPPTSCSTQKNRLSTSLLNPPAAQSPPCWQRCGRVIPQVVSMRGLPPLLLCHLEAWGWESRPPALNPHHLQQRRDLTLTLTSCSAQVSGPCTSTEQRGRTDPTGRGVSELTLEHEYGRSGPHRPHGCVTGRDAPPSLTPLCLWQVVELVLRSQE